MEENILMQIGNFAIFMPNSLIRALLNDRVTAHIPFSEIPMIFSRHKRDAWDATAKAGLRLVIDPLCISAEKTIDFYG